MQAWVYSSWLALLGMDYNASNVHRLYGSIPMHAVKCVYTEMPHAWTAFQKKTNMLWLPNMDMETKPGYFLEDTVYLKLKITTLALDVNEGAYLLRFPKGKSGKALTLDEWEDLYSCIEINWPESIRITAEAMRVNLSQRSQQLIKVNIKGEIKEMVAK